RFGCEVPLDGGTDKGGPSTRACFGIGVDPLQQPRVDRDLHRLYRHVVMLPHINMMVRATNEPIRPDTRTTSWMRANMAPAAINNQSKNKEAGCCQPASVCLLSSERDVS